MFNMKWETLSPNHFVWKPQTDTGVFCPYSSPLSSLPIIFLAMLNVIYFLGDSSCCWLKINNLKYLKYLVTSNDSKATPEGHYNTDKKIVYTVNCVTVSSIATYIYHVRQFTLCESVCYMKPYLWCIFFGMFSPNTGSLSFCLHALIVFQVGFPTQSCVNRLLLVGMKQIDASVLSLPSPISFPQIPLWQCRRRARLCFPWTSGWESGECALVRTRRSSPHCTRLYSSRRSPLSPAPPSPSNNCTSTSG